MFRNIVKIAWRHLWRFKRYTAINISGFAIGTAVMLILYQFIAYHLSFDQYHPFAKRLYRVVTDLHLPDGSVEFDPGAPIVMADQLKASLPQVENYALLLGKRSFTVSVPEPTTGGKLFFEDKNVAFANPQWFAFFSYSWQEGHPATALSKPNTAVITKSLAEKYFGENNPVGRTIRLDNKYLITITGVVNNPPPNTDIKAEMFVSFASFKTVYPDIYASMTSEWDWVSSSTYLFALLQEGASPQQADQHLARLVRKNLSPEFASSYRFRFQPLSDIHFDTRYGGVIQKSMLTALGLVGLLLLVIVSVNFINLATAQSAIRSREIGIRKVMGSSRSSLFFQSMAETAIITLSGFLVAAGLIQFLLPSLNTWLNVRLSAHIFNDGTLLPALCAFFMLITFCAGFYPALVLSGLQPVKALKNQLDKAQTASSVRRLLILSQNAIAQVLIICTLAIAMQLNFLKTTDLGFEQKNILMVPIPEPDKSRMTFLRNQLLSDPAVVQLSFCSRPPSSEGGGGTIRYNHGDWLDFAVRSRPADIHYLKTFGLQLIAGRNLSESDTMRELVVNEQLLLKLGIRDPQEILGKPLVAGELSQNPGTVVGVVKDFHSSNLYAPKEPLLITTQSTLYNKMAVKVKPGQTAAAVSRIRTEWKALYPNHVFDYAFLSDELQRAYQTEDVIGRLLGLSVVVAILLSSLGCFGLISLIAVQRGKEISIRKVLGASVAQIMLMLSLDFLKLVGIATVIASPLAWYVMNRYLQQFAYRIDLYWWLFVLSTLLTTGLVLITISAKAWQASTINPAKTLKAN